MVKGPRLNFSEGAPFWQTVVIETSRSQFAHRNHIWQPVCARSSVVEHGPMMVSTVAHGVRTRRPHYQLIRARIGSVCQHKPR